MEISNTCYFSVQAWMVNELNLKGAERDAYAIIYGYSQDGDSDFHGSLEYMSQLTGYSRNAICTALKSLTDKGLIIKTEKVINNIKHCRYHTSSLYGVQVACTETNKSVQVACTNNNILNNNKENISKDIVQKPKLDFGKTITKTKPKKLSMYDKCVSAIDEFTTDGTLRTMLCSCLKLFLDNSKENDTPFYTNNFKGKLNKLAKLSDNLDIQVAIVKQTLDNGWNNFYELKQNKSKSSFGESSGVYSTNYNKADDIAGEELENEGKQRYF